MPNKRYQILISLSGFPHLLSILSILLIISAVLGLTKGVSVGASLLKISGILSMVSWANVLAVSWEKLKGKHFSLQT